MAEVVHSNLEETGVVLIRPVVNIGAVALEDVHKCLRHSVGLWTPNRSKARYRAQLDSELNFLVSSIGATVAGEPLDRGVDIRAAQKLFSTAFSIRCPAIPSR